MTAGLLSAMRPITKRAAPPRRYGSKRINGAAAARLLAAFGVRGKLSRTAMAEMVGSPSALSRLLGALESDFGLVLERQSDGKYVIVDLGWFDFRALAGSQQQRRVIKPDTPYMVLR